MIVLCARCKCEVQVNDIPEGIPGRDSLMSMAKRIQCDSCHAADKIIDERKDDEHFLNRSLLNAELCDWDPVKGARNASLMAWVAQNSAKSLFIADNVGSGKTRAVCHVCVKTRKSHPWVQFWKTINLLNAIMIHYHNSVCEMNEFKQKILGLDLLILDDFGKEKITDRAGEVMFDILDEYYADSKKKIWITCNVVDGEAMAKHLGADKGYAITRRIKEKCIQWQAFKKN
jgi:DNA replication protein DnaC